MPRVVKERKPAPPTGKRRRVLLVLFVPSVERDGKTAIDQRHWRDGALETLGTLYGGATAFPRAEGIWRDDERGGRLVRDKPIVLHCYATREDVEDEAKLAELGAFCRRMGRDTNQGEVGLVVGDEYLAITGFEEK